MSTDSIPAWGRSAVRLARGVLLIAVVTAVCFRVQLNSASTALLFLIAVVLQSLDCKFWEAAVISVCAALSLDYFFTQPLFSLAVEGPLDLVTLVCLLTVSVVITRIQTRSRAEAEQARLQRSNTECLYQVSQALLSLKPPVVAGVTLLEPFLKARGVAAVCLLDAVTMECHRAGAVYSALEIKTRAALLSGQDSVDADAGLVVQCLHSQDAIPGAIGFAGLRDAEVMAPALATLASAALERGRAFRSATTAAARAEAEAMRSAILDALAHEFRTPLTTIMTAAGGLRTGVCSVAEHAELAEMIESEASRLGELAARLLRLARVDREELQPRLQSADARELVERSIGRYARLWPDRKISFAPGETYEAHVDPELVGLALSQLVENACRYSLPDGRVLVELGSGQGMASITIWNDGPPVPEEEREHIFERFYRGSAARRTAPGSGLGLYIARKIALGHGGDLVIVDNSARSVGFRLSVPLAGDEASGDDGKR